MQPPGQAQRGSGEGSEGSGKFRRRIRGALVQSQVRFNRVLEKVPEKVPGSLGAKPSQVQQGSGEGSGEGREPLVQSQVRFNRALHQGFLEPSPEPSPEPC